MSNNIASVSSRIDARSLSTPLPKNTKAERQKEAHNRELKVKALEITTAALEIIRDTAFIIDPIFWPFVLSSCAGPEDDGNDKKDAPPSNRVNNFAVSGSDLIDTKTGQKMFLKGIDYSPFMPGETPYWGANLPNDDRYAGHLNTIKGLNANFVMLFPQFTPSNFFKALDGTTMNYAQDIYVDGWTNDLLDPTFQNNSIAHIKKVIDHTYSTGKPEKLVFFSVGDEINAGTIFRTDSDHPAVTTFDGNYIDLTGNTPSEVAIAKLMDAAMTYEQDKYGVRHLYCHTSWTHIGPVANRTDLEVAPGSVFFADYGDLICMNIYTYARGVVTSPAGSVTGRPYQGYIEDLAAISTKPVIITQVGLSTSPYEPTSIPDFGGNSYAEVSTKYPQIWQDVKTANGTDKIAGLAWFEFSDEWWKNGEIANDDLAQENNDPEEWFGMYSVIAGDNLTAKGAIPDTVKTIFAP